MGHSMNYLDEFENRDSPRFKCNYSVGLGLPESGRSWNMKLIEVSTTGFRLESDYRDLPILPGTVVQLSVSKLVLVSDFKILGRIIYFGVGPDGKDLLGVQMISEDLDVTSKWDHLVNQIKLNQEA